MELKWRQSTTTFGGPHILCARMGCHSPSPTVPSSLFASFPFLTEKEARGSPRNGNYRRNLFCETLGKEAGELIREQGGAADGVWRSREARPSQFLLQLLPSNGVNGGNDQTARQKDSTSQPLNSFTGKRAGKAPVFSPWPLGWVSI